MPRGDGTGPMGAGTLSGRGAGYCAGFSMPGFANCASGRGMRMGRGLRPGFGLGMGRNFYAFSGYAACDESAALRNQARFLSDALDLINKRIAELGTQKVSNE